MADVGQTFDASLLQNVLDYGWQVIVGEVLKGKVPILVVEVGIKEFVLL